MLLCSSRQFAAKRQPVEKPHLRPGRIDAEISQSDVSAATQLM
jgi:hypothetical protein